VQYKKKVDTHLEECSKCREELEQLRQLVSGMEEHKEVFSSPHIEPGKLVIFDEETETLNPEEAAGIVKHLQSCSSCSEELQTLRRANLELEALERRVEPKPAREVSVWHKILTSLWWLVHKPAFAYAIVILLAYPAARWLIPKLSPVEVYVLSEQTRTPQEPIRVLRGELDEEVKLRIPYWPDVENQRYDLRIVNESGATVLMIQNFTNFEDQGFFRLDLNAKYLPDGEFFLIVKEISREDSTKFEETRFPFRLVTEEE
jgi:hypothetical protein